MTILVRVGLRLVEPIMITRAIYTTGRAEPERLYNRFPIIIN